MKQNEIEQLAVDYQREVVDGNGGETDAVDRLQTLVWYDPESAWEVALRVLHGAKGENAAAILGAGVFEQLLGVYPEQFIPRVVRFASEDPRIARAMKYVDIRADEIPREYFDQFAAMQLKWRDHD